MAKVSDVLKLSVMRGVRVVAGEEGLFRKVEHVTVMEVPEIKRWLKGNDFLITSFYSVRKSEEDQCALIRDLADTRRMRWDCRFWRFRGSWLILILL